MRKLPLLLLGISIAACHSKKNITAHSIINSDHAVTIKSSLAMDDIDGLQPLLVDAPQVFIVATKTIKKIEAKNGLRITVDANNLETADGQPVSGDVQVTIKEMEKASDMIANNCPTVSDGKMLISDGSYYVGMINNGKQLQIKKGKSLQMEFPRFSKNEMELFRGVRTVDGAMNWIPLNKKLANETADKQVVTSVANGTSYQYTNYDYSGFNYDRFREQTLARIALGFPTVEWRSFEDSVMALRKDSIICHYKSLTQMQMWKILQSPFKISVKDRYKYGMSAWHIINIKDQASLRWWFTNGFGQFLVSDNNPDSLIYYRDFNINYCKEVLRKKDSINNSIRTMDSIYLVNSVNSITPDNIGAIVDKDKGNSSSKTKTSLQYYAPVEITDLGWINCDHFYDAPDGVTPEYTLNLKDAIPANVGVYMIFHGINSMLEQRVCTLGKNSIVVDARLPLNSKVEFLIYSKINNKFVQCKETATVTKDLVLPVVFTPVPDGQVKKYFLN